MAPHRAHEAYGPGARAFAAAQAGLRRGPVVWVLPPRPRETLDPYGLAAFFDPARLGIGEAREPGDALWAMEEALRSGAAPIVIAEPPRPPDLTQGRRLQLAAEAGRSTGLTLLGAKLGPRRGGAAETRWRVEPAPSVAPEASFGAAEARLAACEESARRASVPLETLEALGAGRARVGTGPPDARRSSGLCAPGAPDGFVFDWFWTLEKNKRGPLGAWRVGWAAGAWRGGGRGLAEAPAAAGAPRLAADGAGVAIDERTAHRLALAAAGGRGSRVAA